MEEINLRLIIEDNKHLKNIDVFQNLNSFGLNPPNVVPLIRTLTIAGNDSLFTLFPLSNINAIINSLTIEDNEMLSVCSIAPICQVLSNPMTEVNIFNNAPGCNSREEVLDACRSNQVLVFHDLNLNNLLDEDEKGLPIGKLNINDNYEILSNNSNGKFIFFDAGENAFIEYIPEDHWEIAGPTAVYNLSSDIFNHFEIGIAPTEEIHDVDVSFAFDAIICDQTYVLTAIVENSGTTYKNVDLAVKGSGVLNSTIQMVNADGFVEYELVNLKPGEIRKTFLLNTAPDVTEVMPGDVITLSAKVSFDDENGNIQEKQKDYKLIFLCAYDPRDKQVFPAGVQEENYTLFEDKTLEYKIRFQNTGNFPAEDIVIVDTLNEFLDLSTLKFIHASHPVSEIKLDRNVVGFRFENIFLSDFIANEPESRGFVQFSIETFEDLKEFTEIENTAHIYFDTNPAIVTNAVFNIFVSEIPMGSNTNDLEKSNSKLMPDPSKDFIHIETAFAERGQT